MSTDYAQMTVAFYLFIVVFSFDGFGESFQELLTLRNLMLSFGNRIDDSRHTLLYTLESKSKVNLLIKIFLQLNFLPFKLHTTKLIWNHPVLKLNTILIYFFRKKQWKVHIFSYSLKHDDRPSG